MPNPNVFVDVTLYLPHENGRISPTPNNFFNCVFILGGSNYDGRMILNDIGSIKPGETKKAVPIAFLSPHKILTNLKLGTKLFLWEGKIIGEAIVSQLL